MSETAGRIDPITLGVLGGAFQAIGLEMGHALKRMAYSPAAQQVEDLGGGLFTVDGREICESDSSPMHIGSLPFYIGDSCAASARQDPRRRHHHPQPPLSRRLALRPTCAWRCRSSTTGGCSASPPRRAPDRHRCRGAGLDVDLIDVFAEGTLYNSVKLYERGVRNEQVWRHHPTTRCARPT